MPIYPQESQPSYTSIQMAGWSRPRPSRHLWPGLLMLALAAGLLGLSLLALIGMAGMVVGVGNVQRPTLAVAPTRQPAPIVLVIPGTAPVPVSTAMPAPSELAAVAAAPLPTLPPTVLPSSDGPVIDGPDFGDPGRDEPILDRSSDNVSREQLPGLARPEKSLITYSDLFRTVGEQTGIDWRLLAAVAYRESRMNPLALGRDGDMGLMQILPTTWDEFAPQVAAHNPFDPRENVQVSAAYLVYLQEFALRLETNDLRWVLVSYNWGPERVRRLLMSGGRWDDVPALQQRYVADILYHAFGVEEDE